MTISPRPAMRSLMAAALAAAAVMQATSASAAPPLAIASTVALPGTPPAGPLSPPIAAESPDGTVYVGTRTSAGQSVYSVSAGGAAHRLDKVTGVGTITALAADSANVYVGTHLAISAYSRSNGKLLSRWTLSPTPRALSQLVVAGNRVWGLLTPVGSQPAPSSLVELDPTQQARVATVNGVADTLSIAAATNGIEYVASKGSTLVRRTNSGVVTSKPTHLTVNLTLSGPGAVQAQVISGSRLFVKFTAGQGLDAVTYTYDAATLTGRQGPNNFSAARPSA